MMRNVRGLRATTRCAASSVACAAASRKSGEPVFVLKYSTRHGAQSAESSSGFMATRIFRCAAAAFDDKVQVCRVSRGKLERVRDRRRRAPCGAAFAEAADDFGKF